MSPLPNRVLDVADRWWAGDFDCDANDVRPAGIHVQAHAGRMTGAAGIWMLAVGAHAPLVSLPPAAVDLLGERARRWSRALMEDHAALTEELTPLEIGTVVGPASISYGTTESLDLSRAREARDLGPEDAGAVAGLREACSDEAWDHGGSAHGDVPTFGAFTDDGRLAALAGYKTWNDEIAHIAIVSAGHLRGRGFATAAVARAAEHALGAGLVAQYRTLMANTPSMAIAHRLGFEAYGISTFVRLPVLA